MQDGNASGIFDTILDQMGQFGVKVTADAKGLEIIIPKSLCDSAEWVKYARTQTKGSDYTDPLIKVFGLPITWSNILKDIRVRRDLKKLILPRYHGKEAN